MKNNQNNQNNQVVQESVKVGEFDGDKLEPILQAFFINNINRMKKLDQHNYNGIDATIIADSKNEYGNRITSFIVTFPRIVLAEFNTHRALARNSASSRAVPFKKMLKKVQQNPFIPIAWQKDHKGMQGTEYHDPEELHSYESFEQELTQLLGKDHDFDFLEQGYLEHLGHLNMTLAQWWLFARDRALEAACIMSIFGVTKQIVNRLLEPWMWHTAITTATEWENFFALRAHGAAEIHIADLAEKMLVEYNDSEPKLLKEGEWHIPFGDNMEIPRLQDLVDPDQKFIDDVPYLNLLIEKAQVKIATARCARVSYLNFEGKDDYNADIILHDKLSSPDYGHWSPFEHCGEATGKDVQSGNLKGFIQYRKMFDNENKSDERVLIK